MPTSTTEPTDAQYRCAACGDRLVVENEVAFSTEDGGNICPTLSNLEMDDYQPHDPEVIG